MHFTVLRQALKRGKISPRFAKSVNPREIYFSPGFWISAVGGEMHFTASGGRLSKGINNTRFAKSVNPREIYFSPRFLDFRRRRGDICPK